MNNPSLWAIMHRIAGQKDYSNEKSFEQSWEDFWSPFEKKCRSIAQNQYIMNRAVQHFKTEYVERKRKFQTVPLWAYIVRECEALGMDPDEYLHWGWAHFVRRCESLIAPENIDSL